MVMSDNAATLTDTIEMLRSFGPSVLLVRCLLLEGRTEEAHLMSQHLAPLESARLAACKDAPLKETAELRLRNIFCQVVAGFERNARLMLGTFSREAEQLASERPEDLQDLIPQLAVGAILVDNPELSKRVLAMSSDTDVLSTRILRSWLEKDTDDLSKCVDELKKYIQDTELPPWSDTLVKILSGDVNLKIYPFKS
jgi:hypothetical protein